jgi:ABC-type antimicrobial peptide transport system permease subunit
VRTKQNPASLFQPVRQIMHSLDPELSFSEVHTLYEEVDASLWQERLLAALASAFGALATVLAAIGLYALLNYLVRTRTREIGIRMALGAAPARIVNMVSFHTLVMVLPGVLAGLAAYWASAHWIQHLLYGVEPADPASLVFAVALVLGVGILATSPAAWRAVRIDPARALRQDR